MRFAIRKKNCEFVFVSMKFVTDSFENSVKDEQTFHMI